MPVNGLAPCHLASNALATHTLGTDCSPAPPSLRCRRNHVAPNDTIRTVAAIPMMRLWAVEADFGSDQRLADRPSGCINRVDGGTERAACSARSPNAASNLEE